MNTDKLDKIALEVAKEGERYVGCIVSADGTKREHIILLPGEFKGTWDDAIAWAQAKGGELFDRTEGALLFATMKAEFKEDWHWTREQHAEYRDYAWMQTFYNGSQDCYHKSATGRGRAVRRLEIADHIADLEQRLTAALERAERAEKDAARFAYLRDWFVPDDSGNAIDPPYWRTDFRETLLGETFDEAIDAAIERGKEEGK